MIWSNDYYANHTVQSQGSLRSCCQEKWIWFPLAHSRLNAVAFNNTSEEPERFWKAVMIFHLWQFKEQAYFLQRQRVGWGLMELCYYMNE